MNIDKALNAAGTGRDSDSDTPMDIATEEPATLILQLPVRFHHLCHLSEPPENNHMLTQLPYQPWSLACVQRREDETILTDAEHTRTITDVVVTKLEPFAPCLGRTVVLERRVRPRRGFASGWPAEHARNDDILSRDVDKQRFASSDRPHLAITQPRIHSSCREVALQHLRGLFLTLRLHLESRPGQTVSIESSLAASLIRHAAWPHTRVAVASVEYFEQLQMRRYRSSILEHGNEKTYETVLTRSVLWS